MVLRQLAQLQLRTLLDFQQKLELFICDNLFVIKTLLDPLSPVSLGVFAQVTCDESHVLGWLALQFLLLFDHVYHFNFLF